MKVYFSLGSNLGDREGNLHKAIKMMSKAFAEADNEKEKLPKLSSIIETEAWGFESEEKFLNCVCCFETNLSCRTILNICQDIERKLGKNVRKPQYDKEGKRVYESRNIDIDILLYGNETINEEDLKIPHERMYERDFVMIPLNELMNSEK